MKWLGRETSELDRLAEENWPATASAAGFPAKGWRFKRLSRRDDPHVASITQLAAHKTAGQFTYKFQLRPHVPEGFGAHFRLQEAAHERFPHSETLTLPRAVYLDEARQVSLLQYIDGQAMSDAIKATRNAQDELDLLCNCGAWLDAFHRQGHDMRKFRPGHTLKYYEGIRAQIERKELQVAAPSLYLRGIERLRDLAPAFDGQPTVGAIQHGDFHLRNLIWNGHQVAGIDVSKGQVAPIGFDVAKILLDFTTVFRSDEGVPPGEVVHPETAEAFFSGYKLAGAEDASVRFLLHARILATLNTVQAAERDRTEAKQRTLQRLRPIARNAFRKAGAQSAGRHRRSVLFFLTKRSLEAARSGQHEMVEAVKLALEPHGFKVGFRRNGANQRMEVGPDDLTLVHMSNPVGARGLVFRRAYAGPFWHIERCAARWDWEIARKPFVAEDIDQGTADLFFEHWRKRVLPDAPGKVRDDGFVYMPLQGKLLQKRSFQRASPIEMIARTLAHSNEPVRATLHPNETYSEAELEALHDIASREGRFELVDLPMHEALAACRYLVTQNSSAAFHGILYEKPSILFAQIDFQHICLPAGAGQSAGAFAQVRQAEMPFRKYLYWYWGLNCLSFEAADQGKQLVSRLDALGWQVRVD